MLHSVTYTTQEEDIEKTMLVEQTSHSNLSTHPTRFRKHRFFAPQQQFNSGPLNKSFRLEAVLLQKFSTCCKSSTFLKLIYPRLFMMGSRAPIRSWKIIAPIRSPGYFSIYFTFIFVNLTRILFPSLQCLQQNPQAKTNHHGLGFVLCQVHAMFQHGKIHRQTTRLMPHKSSR